MDDSKPRSFGETMLAVAWSFIGLRRRSDFERDVGALRPGYVIAGGLIAASCFVALLLCAVRLATS
ncbi:DUF2970 domain-containing protein [Pseudoduganella sp. S-14]|jgi:hypothetical protein|uniref:DUF2970 domain-containing protein n=1 Tax=Pseudoduganella sp. S-14 TaxID=3404065 RepID=UPI003CECFCA9